MRKAYKAYLPELTLRISANSADGFWCAAAHAKMPEGKVRGRTVVVEFPSYDAALVLLSLAGLRTGEKVARR